MFVAVIDPMCVCAYYIPCIKVMHIKFSSK